MKRQGNQNAIYRVLDANLNRCKEAFRVLEDLARFILNDSSACSKLKSMRHRVTQASFGFSVSYAKLLQTRHSQNDVGKTSSIVDKKKTHLSDVAAMNFKRTQESLRVLEEVSKLITPKLHQKFQTLRFECYELEKKILRKF